MPGDGLYAPMSYSTTWLVIGLVIVAALLGWGVVIWWQTREPRPDAPAPGPPPGWRLAQLKADYVARIDELVRLADHAEISPRRAHQELSLTVRQFVEEASGLHAPTMTLSELGRSGVASLAPVTDVVLRLYPVEFGPDASVPVGRAADVARQVVSRWT